LNQNPKFVIMKRILFLILAVVVFGCTKPGYKLTVTLTGAEGKAILEKREAGKFVGTDSADFKKGVAVLSGVVVMPDMYFLSVAGKRAKMIVFLENSPISVNGKADSLNVATVTGSKVHDEFTAIEKKKEKIYKEYREVYKQANDAKTAGDTVRSKELMAKVEEIYKGVGVIEEDFVKNNPGSYAAPYFLQRISYEKSAAELEKLLSTLDPKLASSQTIVALKDRVEKMKTVEVGKNAPDFTQNDTLGNPVKLSDVYSKNEYTLVDFWASWCGPCRGENPNVVAVYNAYKDKGFGVFGVSLDRDKDKWLSAIEKDKLTWPHVSDLKYWENAAAKLYAVNSIPANFLLNKKGEIIGIGLRGDKLKAKIAELLDKK
jgi:peroxiredoxin